MQYLKAEVITVSLMIAHTLPVLQCLYDEDEDDREVTSVDICGPVSSPPSSATMKSPPSDICGEIDIYIDIIDAPPYAA
jgi:hypothetical protein